jgi:hypothetical protein
MITGWPPGLLQDDSKGLSHWLANRPGARRIVRDNLQGKLMNITAIPYKLIDGTLRATLHADTFEVPTPEEKAAVKVGDHVKLGFVGATTTERMWVLVTGPGTGTLDNDPAFMTEVKYQDEVAYDLRHILSVLPS